MHTSEESSSVILCCCSSILEPLALPVFLGGKLQRSVVAGPLHSVQAASAVFEPIFHFLRWLSTGNNSTKKKKISQSACSDPRAVHPIPATLP